MPLYTLRGRRSKWRHSGAAIIIVGAGLMHPGHAQRAWHWERRSGSNGWPLHVSRTLCRLLEPQLATGSEATALSPQRIANAINTHWQFFFYIDVSMINAYVVALIV